MKFSQEMTFTVPYSSAENYPGNSNDLGVVTTVTHMHARIHTQTFSITAVIATTDLIIFHDNILDHVFDRKINHLLP